GGGPALGCPVGPAAPPAGRPGRAGHGGRPPPPRPTGRRGRRGAPGARGRSPLGGPVRGAGPVEAGPHAGGGGRAPPAPRAAADASGLVKLRAPAPGAVVRTLSGHQGGATSVAFSGDGTTLAVGGADGVACLWDVRTGRMLVTFHQAGLLERVASGSERVIT